MKEIKSDTLQLQRLAKHRIRLNIPKHYTFIMSVLERTA